MKSKFLMVCEECGLDAPVLNEIDYLYYCNCCTRTLMSASRIETYEEETGDRPVPTVVRIRPDFDF